MPKRKTFIQRFLLLTALLALILINVVLGGKGSEKKSWLSLFSPDIEDSFCNCGGNGVVANGGGGVAAEKAQMNLFEIDGLTYFLGRGVENVQTRPAHASKLENFPAGCMCQCTEDYLAPHCLYRREDLHVPLALWIRPTITNKNFSSLLLADDILDDLCSAVVHYKELQKDESMPSLDNKWCTNSTILKPVREQMNFRYALTSEMLQGEGAAQVNTDWDTQMLKFVVEVPGWVAQSLIAASWEMEDSSSSLEPSVKWFSLLSHLGGGHSRTFFSLVSVEELTITSAPLLAYRNQWLRFYWLTESEVFGSAIQGVSVGWPELYWVAMSVLLVLILTSIEKWFLFNVDRVSRQTFSPAVVNREASSRTPLLTTEKNQPTEKANPDSLSEATMVDKQHVEEIEMTDMKDV